MTEEARETTTSILPDRKAGQSKRIRLHGRFDTDGESLEDQMRRIPDRREIRIKTVSTGRETSWSRDEIYDGDGR